MVEADDVARERRKRVPMARIPFSQLRSGPPDGLQALYVDVEADQAVIPGLRMGVGSLIVQRWNPGDAAAGWTLYRAELTLEMGLPFGALFYRNDGDSRLLRIGVKWHPPAQELQFPALDPSKPELTRDCTSEEIAAVVLDARSRIGALVAANAMIGSFVATRESETAILEASGFGLERLPDPDAEDPDR